MDIKIDKQIVIFPKNMSIVAKKSLNKLLSHRFESRYIESKVRKIVIKTKINYVFCKNLINKEMND